MATPTSTPTRVNSVEETTDVLSRIDVNLPCTSKSVKTSRLQGRVKGKVLFAAESSQGKIAIICCRIFWLLAQVAITVSVQYK